jgi:hypothetical protein
MIIAANSAISVPRPGITKGTAANTEAIIVTRTTCGHRSLFLTLIFHLPDQFWIQLSLKMEPARLSASLPKIVIDPKGPRSFIGPCCSNSTVKGACFGGSRRLVALDGRFRSCPAFGGVLGSIIDILRRSAGATRLRHCARYSLASEISCVLESALSVSVSSLP